MNDLHAPPTPGSRKRSRLAWMTLASLAAAAVVHNRTRKAERENPPPGKFVEVEGVRLHYVERGSGEPLVLLHGNTTMGLDFMLSDLVEMAARRYRVIVFDRPGYGHSDRPRGLTVWGAEAQARLFRQAFEKIGAERPIVLGHSWGAIVAMAIGLDHPQSVRCLVLESGYYYPTARPDILIAAPPAIPVIGDLMRHTWSPLMFRMNWPLMVKRMFAPAQVPEHFWRFPAWMGVRPFQLRASAAEIALVAPVTARLSRRYHELSVPAVIIAGREDRLVHQDAHSERLFKEALPQADFRLIDGMGHMLHHLVPQRVMEAIDAAAALAPGGGRAQALRAGPQPVAQAASR